MVSKSLWASEPSRLSSKTVSRSAPKLLVWYKLKVKPAVSQLHHGQSLGVVAKRFVEIFEVNN